MKPLTREEKNEQIAKILGFQTYGIKVNGKEDAVRAWQPPPEYYYLKCGEPMFNCPDFVAIIDEQKKIKDILRGYVG